VGGFVLVQHLHVNKQMQISNPDPNIRGPWCCSLFCHFLSIWGTVPFWGLW